MPAYMIFTREGPIFNQAEMEAYSSRNRSEAGQSVEKYGLKPLAIYGALETLEGAGPEGVVILEFPSADDARAWYNSPEYQAAAEHRKKGAPYRALLVEGL
ncbi:DUF1330 domain-containing protein [Sphingobium boeckii]|uniref:Uncharacterized protein (DUF1330 family) n=1 Tax=Sphingobium boeckii TaxID=1082345 RepID=A0A7W9AJ96_9SPHN|nr:DUF1330 domain-containing protein [Sphingobium boeckii]MBB5686722.1 uncharacterized protein (DUF1330 family) [Sphingobium boeckii]